jgi:PAS domain S-box-containing protein
LNWNAKFQNASRYLSLIVLGMGILVLIGWVLNIALFKSVLPDLATMKVNTALGLALASISLLYLQPAKMTSRRKWIGQISAGLVFLIGLAVLCQYAFGWNLGIDELIFKDTQSSPNVFPGRPSPVTALCLLLTGAVLLLFTFPQLHIPRRLTATLVAAIGIFSVIGYLYGVTFLYRSTIFSSIAIHTAIAITLLGFAILLTETEKGFFNILGNEGPAGILMRRLFPACIIIPILTGWIILKGLNAGYYDVPASLTLFAILTIVAFSLITYGSARQILQTDQERQRTQAQFKALFDESLDVILVIDGHNSRILNVNNMVRPALHYEPANLIGKHFSTLFPPETEAEQAQIVDELQAFGHVFASQEFLRLDGSICPMDLTATIIPWKNDRAILITLRDASERKLLEAEILRAERIRGEMEKEREVTQLKEDFITMVSHDFRTPLAVIMTSRDMLERYYERLTQPRRAEQLQKIRDQVWYMTGMLDDVLLLGKARAKKLEFNPETIDLKKICWGVFDEARMTDNEKHTFHFNASGQLGNLKLDAKLIHRILSNLLANAVKYSPEGGMIRLELAREENQITLRVSDQGIGIPKKDQARLFEPFHRGGNTSGIVGTGLGLAIVYESVQIHGGSVSVKSIEGAGSIFTICLPA